MPNTGKQLPTILFLVCTVSLIRPGAALYPKNGAVTRLTSDNFETLVLQSSVVSMVKFYSPKCSHCQALAKSYQKVADNLKGIVFLGAVDCDDRRSQKLCADYGVEGLPTIKIFPVDKQQDRVSGTISKTPEDYTGPRNAKSISEFAASKVPDSFVQNLETYDEFRKFVNDLSKIRVILFSDKEKSTLLYQSLSARYHSNMIFAQVHSSLTEAVSDMEVDTFPKLLIFKEGKSHEVYNDMLTAPKLVAYFSKLLESKQNAEDESNGSWMKLGTLEREQLEDIIKTEDMWLVAFMGATAHEETDATSHCKDELLGFTNIVKNIQLMVNVAVVKTSVEDTDAIKKFGVDSRKLADEPCQLQIVRFPFGEQKDEIDEYEMFSGELDAKILQEFVIEAMPNLASEVEAQSVDLFLGGMSASGMNPMIPKIMLFTAKADCPQIYKALAFHFRKWGLAFAFLPEASTSTMERFGIKSLPLMLGFQIDPNASLEEVDPSSPQVPVRIQPYSGPPKFQQMSSWLTMFGTMLGAQPSDVEQGSSRFEPATVSEISDDDLLRSHCAKVGICVIGLLDRNADSFSGDLDILQELAVKRRSDPFGFYWVDSIGRNLLLEGFSVLRSELPTIVALSESKMRYGALREILSLSNVDHFLNGIMSGRVRTASLQELPKMIQVVETESAESVLDAVLEEELDLSEIMSEEIEGEGESKEDLLKRIDEELEAEKVKQQKQAQKKTTKKKKKSKSKKQKKDEL